ncbi:hypothetical protein OsI_38562 [Oryza sativa Indica Group]|uniref:Uncharacterized protein n=1 Tax=Oryza sativa subsp. indica TaxID=39946 RepID=B8BM88_ORYSI|nr:hypothetical protein OsI_38562 [Oryza sativa Indica Group]
MPPPDPELNKRLASASAPEHDQTAGPYGTVTIYPSVKAPVEYSMQASSGDYILWNTLGKCPSAALPK